MPFFSEVSRGAPKLNREHAASSGTVQGPWSVLQLDERTNVPLFSALILTQLHSPPSKSAILKKTSEFIAKNIT